MRYLVSEAGRNSFVATLAVTLGLFLLMSLVFYYASVLALKHSTLRFSRIAPGDIHVSLLVTGNSRARDLLAGRGPSDPPTTFNLAYNGLSRETTFAWIKAFFRQGNTATTVIIETSTLYSDTQTCDSKPYWIFYQDLFAAQRAACPNDVVARRYFPLTVFNSEQYLRALYYLILNRHGDQSWGDDYSIGADLCARLPLRFINEFHDLAAQLDLSRVSRDIADLKGWLADNGYKTKLVFVLAPFLADTRAIPAIRDMERVNDKLLGAENNLSLATALGSDCGNFADTIHVGANGRPKVRSLLWQYLGLTSH
jgi:hypothetical protein